MKVNMTPERQIMLLGWWINYILEWCMSWGVWILFAFVAVCLVVMIWAAIQMRRG